ATARRVRHDLGAPAVAAARLLRCASAEERAGRIHNEAAAERFAADQHPEAHLVAVREGDLGDDLAVDEAEQELDHDAVLLVAGRAANGATIKDRALDDLGVVLAVLPGFDLEADPRRAVALELDDLERVER